MSQIGKEEYESDMWATYVCDSERGGKQLTHGLHQSMAAFAGLDLGWAVSLVVTKSVGPSEAKLLPFSIFCFLFLFLIPVSVSNSNLYLW
jgi:hypothetical protein